MHLPIKIESLIPELCYSIALGLFDTFSRENFRGPKFEWQDVFGEDGHYQKMAVIQVHLALSENQFKRYEKESAERTKYYADRIAKQYLNSLINLGVIKGK